MSPEQRDKTYLWDILDAARRIQAFMADATLHAYEQDKKLQLAIERLLEIIGEASRRLSDGCQAEYGHIPWTSMIGLRNVLIHEYGEIRNDIIWRIATKRIPELIRSLEQIQLD